MEDTFKSKTLRLPKQTLAPPGAPDLTTINKPAVATSETGTGMLYGCVVLHTSVVGESKLTFPFDSFYTERNSHFAGLDVKQEQPFDSWLGGTQLETSKLSAPSRGVTVGGMRVGEPSDTNLTHKIIYRLLTINADATEEDKNLPYLDLVYAKVSTTLTGRMYAVFDVTSSKSKFVLMSKDIPVYLFTASNEDVTYLFWSNEESLRHRMREHYGDLFYYYNLGTLVNGTLVLQSYYLRKLYQKWRRLLRDHLKIMNALEEYVTKKTIRDA